MLVSCWPGNPHITSLDLCGFIQEMRTSKNHPVLIKELQRNAITRQIIHVDLHRISLKDKIEVSVPIHIKGEAPGVKLGGGILEHIIREVRVKCLPTAIPESILVDVSNLQINQAIKAKDLTIPANVFANSGSMTPRVVNIWNASA